MLQDKMPTRGPKIVSLELTPVKVPFKQVVMEAMKAVGGLGMAIPASRSVDFPARQYHDPIGLPYLSDS
ncbi:MAG: hypothetical protein JXA01_07810 [Dehalococcoidia bacterium]|nr:hypothetical protein [Dehalococcoidia bacterium]